MSTRSEDLAWAAGFFDGEGCTSCSKTGRNHQLVFTVAQVDREVLDRFCRIIGAGSVFGPYTRNDHPARRPVFQYRLYGLTAVTAAVDLLWPFLGSVKRRQAQAAIQTRKEYASRPHQSSRPGKLPADVRDQIRRRHVAGETQTAIAEEFGCSAQAVSKMLAGLPK